MRGEEAGLDPNNWIGKGMGKGGRIAGVGFCPRQNGDLEYVGAQPRARRARLQIHLIRAVKAGLCPIRAGEARAQAYQEKDPTLTVADAVLWLKPELLMGGTPPTSASPFALTWMGIVKK